MTFHFTEVLPQRNLEICKLSIFLFNLGWYSVEILNKRRNPLLLWRVGDRGVQMLNRRQKPYYY